MAPNAAGVFVAGESATMATVAAQSTVGSAATSAILRALAKKAGRNFLWGAGGQAVFESLAQGAAYGEIRPKELLRQTLMGGLLQTVSWGMLGPGTRIGQAMPKFLGPLATTTARLPGTFVRYSKPSLLAAASTHAPATLMDSFLWSQFVPDVSFGAQLGIQSTIQASIGGLNRIRPNLGNVVALSLLTVNYVTLWANRVYGEGNNESMDRTVFRIGARQ